MENLPKTHLGHKFFIFQNEWRFVYRLDGGFENEYRSVRCQISMLTFDIAIGLFVVKSTYFEYWSGRTCLCSMFISKHVEIFDPNASFGWEQLASYPMRMYFTHLTCQVAKFSLQALTSVFFLLFLIIWGPDRQTVLCVLGSDHSCKNSDSWENRWLIDS